MVATAHGLRPRFGGLLPPPGPLRPLALATLLSRVANGLLMTVSVLYFDQVVGLTIPEIGLGLTVAGLCGLLSAVPLGHLADRRGPRTLFVVLSLLVAGLSLLYVAVASFWQFLAVAVAVAVVDRGAGAVRFALIAAVTGSTERVRARAYLRAMTNVGVTAGAGIGALALSVGTDAGISLHYSVVDVAIPLWVVGHTDAPRSAAAMVLLINALLVAVLQVRAARGITDPASAARATRTAGLLLLGAMVLFAAASGGGPVLAVVLLAAGALVQVLGELLQSSGSFLLGFDLAAEHAQGQYQGVWNTSTSVSTMLAPAVLALLPLGLGVVGWVVLGAWFAVVGVLFVPVVSWAAGRRTSAARFDSGALSGSQV